MILFSIDVVMAPFGLAEESGDCTYMRAEDIEGSNLLDVMISNGGVLADFAGLANLAHAYSNARHTQV